MREGIRGLEGALERLERERRRKESLYQRLAWVLLGLMPGLGIALAWVFVPAGTASILSAPKILSTRGGSGWPPLGRLSGGDPLASGGREGSRRPRYASSVKALCEYLTGTLSRNGTGD